MNPITLGWICYAVFAALGMTIIFGAGRLSDRALWIILGVMVIAAACILYLA